MGSQYAGDPADYPTDFTIPDDADPPTAAALNVAFEALGDRTAWLRSQSPLHREVFTASGTWTCPEGVTLVMLELWGGGGGGGGGGEGGVTDTPSYSRGGGGGAGSLPRRALVPVAPGEEYAITIGAGGAGGLGGAAPTNGATGGTTVFAHGGPVLVSAIGARGGRATANKTHLAGATDLLTDWFPVARGGERSSPPSDTTTNYDVAPCDGCGGHGGVHDSAGASRARASAGGDGPSFTGGVAGDTPNGGGGGGGGGGAGPGGYGGGGGLGGASVPGGTAADAAGVAGQPAGANSGAGGGGGGGGGNGGVAGLGANGAPGGSGSLTIIFAGFT